MSDRFFSGGGEQKFENPGGMGIGNPAHMAGHATGSVIPLFIDQIRKGEALTLTNPDMTRFMMSLDQAVDLVLFAFRNGRSGDLFVQKSPASTVENLANAVKNLFGKHETEIKVIGTRHGEKVYEVLLTTEEAAKAYDMGEYYRVPADNRDLNYAMYFEEGEKKITEATEYHSHNTYRLNEEEMKKMLLSLHEIQYELKEFGVI